MSVLKLKNSYTRQLEVFEPLQPGRVTMYSCGPTVYSFAHIGNFRSFLFADVLRRVLERNGYEVRHVMNITDVGHMTEDHLADADGEDKLAKAARELGSDPFKVAQHFERAFVEDAKALRLKIYRGGETDDPDLHPRATGHIPEMLAMIQKLLERGYAYVVPTGEVYFSVAKFPEYGQLSGKNIDENEAGARVGVREEKKDPRDFALWKVDKKHLMQWDPHSEKGWDKADYARYRELEPQGVDKAIQAGFPGWHIECSAMSRAHLGSTIDIHTGGEDNMFPHHECEIAQSYGAFGFTVPGPHGAADEHHARKSFARYWLHGRFLLVDNKKMAKRDGNFYSGRDLFDPLANGRKDLASKLEAAGFKGGRVDPLTLRYALISNQYTQQMNFSVDLLVQSRESVKQIQACFDDLRKKVGLGVDPNLAGPASDRILGLVSEYETKFDDSLNDNLNMPNALAAVFGFIGHLKKTNLGPAESQEALRLFESFDEVLEVIDRSERIEAPVVTDQDIAPKLFNVNETRVLRHVDVVESVVALLVRDGLLQQTVANDWFRTLQSRSNEAVNVDEMDDWFWMAFEEGLYPRVGRDLTQDQWIQLVARLRQTARKSREFRIADALRSWLEAEGIEIKDQADRSSLLEGNKRHKVRSEEISAYVVGEAKYAPARKHSLSAVEPVVLRLKAVHSYAAKFNQQVHALLLVASQDAADVAAKLAERYEVADLVIRVSSTVTAHSGAASNGKDSRIDFRENVKRLEDEVRKLVAAQWPTAKPLLDPEQTPLGIRWDYLGYISHLKPKGSS